MAQDEPGPAIFKGVKEIIVANVLEGFYKSYDSLAPSQKNYWHLYDTLEANRALFYNDDDKIVITSVPIHPEHFEATKKLMGWKNVHNIYPEIPLPSISENLLRRGKLSDTLEDVIEAHPGIDLIPYRPTREFYTLVTTLQKKGLDFNTPETVDFDISFVNNYAGSKRGFREIWGRAVPQEFESQIQIPPGFICANKEEAIEAAWWFYKKNSSFVIKYNKGTQGIGILIIEAKKMPSTKGKFIKRMMTKMKDKIWDEPVIIVEEKISVDKEVLGGSPSVEFFIDEKGKVKTLYAGEQILDADRKTFRGFYIHPKVVKDKYIKNAYQAGLWFGKELAEIGYRGFYDIDLVISKDKKLFAVESNLRRTGGTHLHQGAVALLGEDYVSKYHFAGEDIAIPQRTKLSYSECRELFKDLEFDPKEKEGLIYLNPDLLQVNILNIVMVAKTEQYFNYLRGEAQRRISLIKQTRK